MRIYVIRHGLSEGNRIGVIQGYTDSPLCDVGQGQASMLGRYFRREGIVPEKIYTSPLKRACQTAENIASELEHRPEIIPDDGLKEVDVGQLAGLTIEDAVQSYRGCFADVNRWLDFEAAGGEGFDGFYGRVTQATEKIMEGWDLLADRTIFFVAHAGTLRPLLKTLLDAQSNMMYFTFGNCCHARVEYRDVRGCVRRVLSDLIRIETVAMMLGERNPGGDVEDPVGKKIG